MPIVNWWLRVVSGGAWKVNFWSRDVKKRKSSERASSSPRQARFPVETEPTASSDSAFAAGNASACPQDRGPAVLSHSWMSFSTQTNLSNNKFGITAWSPPRLQDYLRTITCKHDLDMSMLGKLTKESCQMRCVVGNGC